jgi:hypothetical protein
MLIDGHSRSILQLNFSAKYFTDFTQPTLWVSNSFGAPREQLVGCTGETLRWTGQRM